MHDIFDAYYRKEIKRDQRAATARANPTARARMEAKPKVYELSLLLEGTEAQELAKLKKMARAARAQGGSSKHIDGRIKALQKIVDKKKKKIMNEDGPMPPPGGDPMAAGPDPGGPPGGTPPMAPPGGGGGPAKVFIQIATEAANFLAQKESELAGLPSDSPELGMVRNAEGLLKDYSPDPRDDDRMVASKIALLAKELRNLEGGNATGEVATYLRAFAGKIDEFRATIDVSDDGADVLGNDDPAPEEPAPKAPAKEPAPEAPPSPQEKQQDLAKNLELNIH